MKEQKITMEMLKEAQKAATPEELKKMASEKGIELSDEEAGKYYAQLHKSGELSDDEIDNVAGGSFCDPSGNPQAQAKCNAYVTLAMDDCFKPGDLICKQCIAYDYNRNACCHGKEKVYY